MGEHYLTRTLAPGASVTVSAAAPSDPPRPDPPSVDVTDLPLPALRELAEAGDLDAQTELGERYQAGDGGVERDYAEAVRWYRRSAEQGHALGQVYLGFMYSNARGVQRDYDEAVWWYRRSAEQGHAMGQNNLGSMYLNGRGVSRNDTEAIRWFRLSADQGEAFGQANLGYMYENGRGVRRDRVEAVRWYRRAADQGDSWAREQLDRLR